MCLGVPGRVVDKQDNALGMTMGTVSFGGIKKEICLAYCPEVSVGDYVIVHVGFAISRIDEDEAKQVFRTLQSMDELSELELPQSGEESIE